MDNTYYFIVFLVLFFGFMMVLVSGNKDILVKIKSLKNGKIYTAKKDKKSKTQTFLDWFYFDEDGNEIENNDLKKLIFEAFYDEDWYGEYDFIVNDSSFIYDIPSPEDILGGEAMPYVEHRKRKEKEVSPK